MQFSILASVGSHSQQWSLGPGGAEDVRSPTSRLGPLGLAWMCHWDCERWLLRLSPGMLWAFSDLWGLGDVGCCVCVDCTCSGAFQELERIREIIRQIRTYQLLLSENPTPCPSLSIPGDPKEVAAPPDRWASWLLPPGSLATHSWFDLQELGGWWPTNPCRCGWLVNWKPFRKQAVEVSLLVVSQTSSMGAMSHKDNAWRKVHGTTTSARLFYFNLADAKWNPPSFSQHTHLRIAMPMSWSWSCARAKL